MVSMISNNKDEETPLVSIGVPTYNRADKLNKTLHSLSKQTYKKLEIVVSDNCSDDTNVQEVVGKYCQSDPRITFYRQKTNLGPANNFEFVREKATGEFFMWMADDDTLSLDYIEKCVQYLVDKPEYVLVAGSAKFYRPDKSCYDGEVIWLPDDLPEDRIIKYLKVVDGNSVFYGVYRTEIIKQIRIYNILAGDWLMIGEIAILGKIHTLKNISIHREASHLTLNDPWGRLFSFYKLPMWAKRFPEIWIGLELKKGIKESKIVEQHFNKNILSWKIFRLIIEKYNNKMSLKKIPDALMAIIFHPIICRRRASHHYEI